MQIVTRAQIEHFLKSSSLIWPSVFFSPVIPAVLVIILVAISVGNFRPGYTLTGWGAWALLTLIWWGLTARRIYKIHGMEVLKIYLVWLLFNALVMVFKLFEPFSRFVLNHN